jgi:hypothetical protein
MTWARLSRVHGMQGVGLRLSWVEPGFIKAVQASLNWYWSLGGSWAPYEPAFAKPSSIHCQPIVSIILAETPYIRDAGSPVEERNFLEAASISFSRRMHILIYARLGQ